MTDRRLQEDNNGIGDFRMTRAMAVVLLVAGSLVVVACGVATFLRYRRDGDDEDEDDGGGDNRDGAYSGTTSGGGRTTVSGDVDNGTAAVGKTVAAADEHQLRRGVPAAAQRNSVGTLCAGGKTNATAVLADKEYHAGSGRMMAGAAGTRNCGTMAGSGRATPVLTPCGGMDATGIPLAPQLHASPTSVLRGGTILYGAKPPPKGSLSDHQHHQPASLPPTGRAPQSYHRNPDIIPAPMMSPGGVYNNYSGKYKNYSFYD